MSAIVLRLEGHRHPVRVGLVDWQRAHVEHAAIAAGESLTTWAIARLTAAAGRGSTFDAAAHRAELDLTTWIRVVLLEAAGMTDLGKQLRRAARR